MESSNQDDYSLISSIDQEVDQQEQDQQEQEYYMGGVGRSYECVFCKRGFNTAQALGGHMNIHRKDKLSTRNKPSTTTHNLLSSNTNNKHEIHDTLSSGANNLRCYHVTEAQSNYVTYFPASASTSTNGQIFLNQSRNSSSRDDHYNNIQCLNLFGENWGSQFGTAATHDVIETMENKVREEDDLDLELRLGHDPLKQMFRN